MKISKFQLFFNIETHAIGIEDKLAHMKKICDN